MTETLAYRTRRKLAKTLANFDRCAGPAAMDPYMPRPARPFDTEAVELVDPATGFAILCTMRVPLGADAALPVVIHTKPADWSPNARSPDGGFITERLAAAGYATINLHHVGSDRIVVPVPVSQVPDKAAYVNRQFYADASHAARVADLRFVLDTLDDWTRQGRYPLDLSRIGMCGFSFGALATCLLIGQRTAPNFVDYRDPRVRAVIAYSNTAPDMDQPPQCFAGIDRPALYMTGTLDFSYGRSLPPERKLAAYDFNTAAGQYAVMFRNADHHCMGGARLDEGKTTPRELRCHQWMHAITLAFWDAHLRGDPDARRWLDHDLQRLLGHDGKLMRK